MPNGETAEQGIDRADLDAPPATVVPERRRLHVVLHLRHDDREKRKIPQDLLSLRGSAKPLKKLLDHEARRHDQVLSVQASAEDLHLRSR